MKISIIDRDYKKALRRPFFALSLLFLSFFTGTTFYALVEGYSLIDAAYMAVITISTVGYGEILPLSQDGRLFTTLYIISNLIIIAFGVSTLTSYLFGGEMNHLLNRYKMSREVRKLKNHVIVCGLGRNGIKACEELSKAGTPFVVVESSEEVLERFPFNIGHQMILGDATADHILIKAGILYAKALITTLPSDAENVFISLTSRELNPKLEVIARASEESSEKKLIRAGANRIVKPDTLGGYHMAQLITKPLVVEFIDTISGVTEEDMQMEEISYDQLSQKYQSHTIEELDIRKITGVSVLGTKKDKEKFQFNPSIHTKIEESTTMIIIGKTKEIEKFKKVYCK
ncbi:potassium channel family protein [Persicobacter diffluens]|uniref:Potassium channel protein n=1 Tax=Persicobacter diffluens TaxID=981 RepID=A0AAN4VT91_9BACT|nr:potassium channel protein [Persicobacter diffluens]